MPRVAVAHNARLQISARCQIADYGNLEIRGANTGNVSNLIDFSSLALVKIALMSGKYWVYGIVASLLVAASVKAGEIEPFQKVSVNNSGATILPIGGAGENGPPLLDPTLPAFGPGTATAVPEPSTIAMLFLGSGCAGACVAFRRRRRA